MSRESWLSVLGLFAVALVARAVFAGQVVFPKPEDTAYYVGVARNLVEGRGLVSDALWSYGTQPLIFPRPAFEVWMPLPTFLAAIPMLVLGPTFQAAQVSSVLIGATVPVLAWRLAADVAAERGMSPVRARTIALGTGLTSAVYLPLVLHSALPDSTMAFTALVLGACLLMTRVLRGPRDGRISDPRLLGLGVLLGLAALTRNEAAWVALTWVLLVVAASGIERPVKVRMIAVVAVVALIVFAPWALRNWSTFGSPLPGQAVTNAFSVSGFDIFAWNDPPTLARYLAVGPARLLEMRVEGLTHNVGNVLLLPGFPLSAIGLLALPWTARGRAVRPVVLVGLITFLVTSLVFPVATTWGTFLHAAGAGPCPDRPLRSAGARCRAGRCGAPPRVDQGGRLARRDDGRGQQPALLRGAPGRLRAGLARHRAAVRGADRSDGSRGPAARRARDAPDEQLPHLGGRDATRVDVGSPRRTAD